MHASGNADLGSRLTVSKTASLFESLAAIGAISSDATRLEAEEVISGDSPLSVFSVTIFGSVLTVKSSLCVDSAFSGFAEAPFGSFTALGVVISTSLGSSLSLRSFARLGSSLSVAGLLNAAFVGKVNASGATSLSGSLTVSHR